MSLLEKKKELIKKTLRSLVLSAASGLTPSKLLQDYECVVGEPLPLLQLGYTSLISFAQDIPDVLRIMYSGRSVIFYGVADESTRHIQSMVRKQRKPKSYASLVKDQPAKKKTPSHRFMPKPRVSNPVLRSYAPAHIRENVCKVLRTLSNGIGLTLFNDIYKQITKSVLNFEYLGFKSLADFFLSMPDIVRLDYGRLTRSGNNLYVHPSKELMEKFSREPKKSTERKVEEPKTHEVKSKEEVKPKEDVKPKPFERLANETKVKAPVQINPPKFCIDTSSSSSKSFSDSDVDDMPQNDMNKTKYDAPLLTSIKEEILQLLEEAPAGIWAIRLSSMYKKKFNKDLKLKEIGYFSVVELMSTMAEKVDISRHDALGDWMLMLRSKKPPARNNNDDSEQVPVVNISQRIVDLLKPGPVTIKELTFIYEQKFHDKLPKQRGELVEILLEVPEISIKHDKGEVIIALESSINDANKKNLGGRPPDACGGDICYMSPALPAKCGVYIDIFLSEITTPGNFCVQICGKNSTGILDDIMDQLEQFYCGEFGDRYKVPENMVKIGLVCAAIFMEDNNWHRAIILRVIDSERVDVLYVDYGSVCNIHIEYVRLLHARFLQLPAQMIAARLADVQPVGKQWTAKSREFLLDMCRDKPIVAYVKSIKDRVMSLYLCDTSRDDVDIHINDHIIHNGHAIFCPDNMSMEDMALLKQFAQEDERDLKKPVRQPSRIAPERDLNNNVPTRKIEPAAQCSKTQIMHHSDTDELPPLTEDNYFLPLKNEAASCSKSQSCQNIAETSSKPTVKNVQQSRFVTQPKVIDDSREQIHFAKKYTLANGTEFHIIYYDNQVYMTSADISALLNKSRDVLHGLLMMRNLPEYSERVVGHNARSEPLFNDMIKAEVRGLLGEGKSRTIVCLYLARDVPEILDSLSINRDIVEEVDSIINGFDKYDSFWWRSNSPALVKQPSASISESAKSPTKTTSKKQDLCLEGLSLESLLLLKKEYCDQRQNVIKEMVVRGGSAETVTRLKQMEDAIRNITSTIQHHDNVSELENSKQKVALFDQYWMIDQVLFKPNETEEVSVTEVEDCNNASNLAGSLHGRCEVTQQHDNGTSKEQTNDNAESDGEELMYIPNEKSTNDVTVNWDEVRQTKLNVNCPEFVPKSQKIEDEAPTEPIISPPQFPAQSVYQQPIPQYISPQLPLTYLPYNPPVIFQNQVVLQCNLQMTSDHVPSTSVKPNLPQLLWK